MARAAKAWSGWVGGEMGRGGEAVARMMRESRFEIVVDREQMGWWVPLSKPFIILFIPVIFVSFFF